MLFVGFVYIILLLCAYLGLLAVLPLKLFLLRVVAVSILAALLHVGLLLLLRHVTPNLAQLHRHLGDLHGRILGLDLTSLLVRKEEEGRHRAFGRTLFHEQTQMLIRGLCFDGRAFGRPGRAEDHRTWSSRDCTGFYLLRLV